MRASEIDQVSRGADVDVEHRLPRSRRKRASVVRAYLLLGREEHVDVDRDLFSARLAHDVLQLLDEVRARSVETWLCAHARSLAHMHAAQSVSMIAFKVALGRMALLASSSLGR